jgi:hypothetical protein
VRVGAAGEEGYPGLRDTSAQSRDLRKPPVSLCKMCAAFSATNAAELLADLARFCVFIRLVHLPLDNAKLLRRDFPQPVPFVRTSACWPSRVTASSCCLPQHKWAPLCLVVSGSDLNG